MFKKTVILLIGCAITGCSDPEPIEIDINRIAAEEGLSPEGDKVHENGAIEVHSKVDTDKDDVAWYQNDLSEPVENIGMLDANAILTSAGLNQMK